MRRALRLLWAITWPVRQYWLHSERKLGKQLVLDRIVKPLLPRPPKGFETELPGGGKVFLHYREDIGLTTLMSGGFERAELDYARSYARPHSWTVDAGANVGVFTVVLALATGPSGRVLAFEPFPDNMRRLRDNLARNALANVDVHELALSDREGELELELGADPAYHSTAEVFEGRRAGARVRVRARTLDAVWREAGAPAVSFVKLDTEGSELSVLRGAEELVRACRPVLLVEDRDGRAAEWLSRRGYARERPRGFAPANALFRPIEER